MVVEMFCLMMAVQKRTKKEIMEEVIAKSKYFKASVLTDGFGPLYT